MNFSTKTSTLFSPEHSTIVACCTPQGSGALALIRLSGADAFNIASKVCTTARGASINFTELPTHTIHYGSCHAQDGTLIDRCMFFVMHAPKTFTGEHTVEITCHNNPLIITGLIQALIQAGAQPAQPGEFTRRAHANKKIDLTQAEAIYDIIHASNEQSLKKSLAQLDGTLSHWIGEIESELVRSLAWCEASFEFLDEGGDFHREIAAQLQHVVTTLRTTLASQATQRHIRNGIRVALLGSVNAGKSSLFNTFLGYQRAIVTPHAGTTRDTIEAHIIFDGITYTLIDTAGLRKTDNIIEAEGIERSRAEAHVADIILLIVDSSRAMEPEELIIYNELYAQAHEKILVVYTKTDLPQLATWQATHALPVNHHSSGVLQALQQKITYTAQQLLGNHSSPFLLNQRHIHTLEAVAQQLETVIPSITKHVQYELLSYQLREIIEQMSELTGKSVSEKALDTVFKEFCVGK